MRASGAKMRGCVCTNTQSEKRVRAGEPGGQPVVVVWEVWHAHTDPPTNKAKLCVSCFCGLEDTARRAPRVSQRVVGCCGAHSIILVAERKNSLRCRFYYL